MSLKHDLLPAINSNNLQNHRLTPPVYDRKSRHAAQTTCSSGKKIKLLQYKAVIKIAHKKKHQQHNNMQMSCVGAQKLHNFPSSHPANPECILSFLENQISCTLLAICLKFDCETIGFEHDRWP